ncbi:hypothetical protein KIN20_030834 [Parelaphostrongylus tenuis]|uniref:Uncharacterized protein n=1 Tax=Parelaphostrongylus tenuis TaxID=148309 RepID=A0AAD5R4M5_PARTN|nr:hypothetical protein KIN20_030834 [Parelaphostrongylus tenuis]
MGERRMASIFPECDHLKQDYDKCFTDFFQKFISSATGTTIQSTLVTVFIECIEIASRSD